MATVLHQLSVNLYCGHCTKDLKCQIAANLPYTTQVMRGYGVQEILVEVIERIYNGSMIKLEMESIMTGWCKSDSGVRQGCPLSPLLFNTYVKELGMKVSACKQGFKYMVVNKDGLIEKKSQAGFLYAGDVCLMASNEPDRQMIFDHISGCISEYGMKVSEKSQRWFV